MMTEIMVETCSGDSNKSIWMLHTPCVALDGTKTLENNVWILLNCVNAMLWEDNLWWYLLILAQQYQHTYPANFWDGDNTKSIQSRFLKFHVKLYWMDTSENAWTSDASDSTEKTAGKYSSLILKNSIFWDVAPCRSCVNWCFRGMYRHLQPPAHSGSSLMYFSTLKMEAIRSSETSVHTRSTRRHAPEDGLLHSRHENLKSYIA
jgi:hypothetical protein